MNRSKSLLSKVHSKVGLNRLFTVLFLFGLTLTWTSCQLDTKESYLILALDRLPLDSFMCSEDKTEDQSGLSLLCKESIRFTHSYTTSLQPAAAMGSLLTGQYPYQHQLCRSYDRIHSQSILLSDLALKNGYRTAFFSGSPNILRKTGLARSFEVFDDSIATQPGGFFKDFKQQSEDFLNWLKEDSKPFLAVIYNSELESINETDTNTANIDKFDEKLFNLFRELKKRNIWEKTNVILLGLQGSNKYNRLNETSFTNLHSENTLIGTFIKIPRIKGDDGVSWKSDLTITLADIGFTLKKMLQPNDMSALISPAPNDFNLLDLSNIWDSKQDYQPRERALLIEAPNPWSKTILEKRYALIYKNYLYYEGDKDRLYNTLTDGFETTDLHPTAANLRSEFIQKIDSVRASAKDEKWVKNSSTELYRLNYDYWNDLNLRVESIKKNPSETNPLTVFLIQRWLKTKSEEPTFKTWATKNKNSYALTTLKVKNAELPRDTCYQLLNKKNLVRDDLKGCTDELFLQFIRFKKAESLELSSEKNRNQYVLLRKMFLDDVRRHSMNLALENVWGLYDPNRNWIHPLMFLDEDFFNSF